MKATMRALVLTWPCLILSQIPPQKLEQQPGSDIDVGLLVAEYLHLLLNCVFCLHPLHHLPVSHSHRRAATPVQRILSPSAAAPPLTVTADTALVCHTTFQQLPAQLCRAAGARRGAHTQCSRHAATVCCFIPLPDDVIDGDGDDGMGGTWAERISSPVWQNEGAKIVCILPKSGSEMHVKQKSLLINPVTLLPKNTFQI